VTKKRLLLSGPLEQREVWGKVHHRRKNGSYNITQKALLGGRYAKLKETSPLTMENHSSKKKEKKHAPKSKTKTRRIRNTNNKNETESSSKKWASTSGFFRKRQGLLRATKDN